MARLSSRRHNPIGKVFSTDELQAIGKMCVKHDLILVSDEVYEHLSFQDPFASPSTSPQKCCHRSTNTPDIPGEIEGTSFNIAKFFVTA